MNAKDLLEKAKKARTSAYAPYSHFAVGAALLAADGRVFLGCNIENAAYSVTCCAERVALLKAISEGVRDFCAIAIVGGPEKSEGDAIPCYPCGVCRQALSEHCEKGLSIYTCEGDRIIESTLDDLLPHSFGKNHLK